MLTPDDFDHYLWCQDNITVTMSFGVGTPRRQGPSARDAFRVVYAQSAHAALAQLPAAQQETLQDTLAQLCEFAAGAFPASSGCALPTSVPLEWRVGRTLLRCALQPSLRVWVVLSIEAKTAGLRPMTH